MYSYNSQADIIDISQIIISEECNILYKDPIETDNKSSAFLYLATLMDHER